MKIVQFASLRSEAGRPFPLLDRPAPLSHLADRRPKPRHNESSCVRC